jgi:hypothetical protein
MPENNTLLSVAQFVERHPAFNMGGVRSLLFYRGYDALKAGAICRFGKRILIDEARFLEWVREGGAAVIRGKGAA